MRFLGWLFGRQDRQRPDRADAARDAIETAQAARKEMDRYVHLRRKEVAGVRLEQMQLRHSINVLEQTILADRLRQESDDAVG